MTNSNTIAPSITNPIPPLPLIADSGAQTSLSGGPPDHQVTLPIHGS
jgi:hypothetical protein